MNVSSTVFEMWSEHDLLSFEFRPLNVSLTLSDIVEILLLHIVLTWGIFDPSFKIIFQGLRRYEADTKR